MGVHIKEKIKCNRRLETSFQINKMRIVEYQRMGLDIRDLPISRLRAIDIQTVEEEAEIAKIIAEKSVGIIPQDKVYIGDIKARMDKEITQRTLTKEKEDEFRKEVDERVAKAINPFKPAIAEPLEVKEEPVLEPVPEVLETKLKKLKSSK